MVKNAHGKNTAYLFNAFHRLTQISITLFSAASGLSLLIKIYYIIKKYHKRSG